MIACRGFIAFLIWSFGLSTLWGDEPVAIKPATELHIPADVIYRSDIEYRALAEKKSLSLDIAYPKQGRGPFPGVICIHGGGWMRSDCKEHVPLCLRLAEAGYVAITVNYRLCPAHRFPDPVHDVKCAVRWLRAHAERYHLDKQQIGAIGFSSGGHLACMLGTTTPKDGLEGDGGYRDESSQVQAVVSFYALTDLARLHERCVKGLMPAFEGALMKMVLEAFTGGTPANSADLYKRASPISHVNRYSAPMLLIHGTADRKVPFEQSVRFEKRLRDCGVPVRLLAFPDAPHDFTGPPEEQARKAAIEFLDRQLKKK